MATHKTLFPVEPPHNLAVRSIDDADLAIEGRFDLGCEVLMLADCMGELQLLLDARRLPVGFDAPCCYLLVQLLALRSGNFRTQVCFPKRTTLIQKSCTLRPNSASQINQYVPELETLITFVGLGGVGAQLGDNSTACSRDILADTAGGQLNAFLRQRALELGLGRR